MSQTAEDLLIIYETEAEQWATYLESVFTGSISGICCYNISAAPSQRDDFLRLAQFNCKLLILSRGLLEHLFQMQRFFLARVLSPAAHVVVLLCGVDSVAPLLELVPLKEGEFRQISSEQDPHEYISTVSDIIRKGVSAANVSSTCKQKVKQMQANDFRSSIVVVPSRVPCRGSAVVFILLKNEAAGSITEVKFTDENQTLSVKPVRWNEQTLCVSAPDFPAGNVKVSVCGEGVPLSKAELHYYSSTEELSSLLSGVADPVDFMCQALQVCSVEKLDQKLASMLLKKMPSGGFQGLQCENTPERELCCTDVPSLLHFAASCGLRSVSSLLLQCPGAERALHAANRLGQTPAEIAKSHGHEELHVLLKEALKMFNCGKNNGDAGVYEMMGTAGNPSSTDVHKEQQGEDEEEEEEEEEEEALYAPLEVNDEYNSILKSTTTVVITNRPPAPTPRPESSQVKEDTIPYIAQVFQKKKTAPQGDAELYSLPTKAACGQESGISPTYDTFVPQQQSTEPQQGGKAGPLTEDKALDASQQDTSSQLRVSTTNSTGDDDGVYGVAQNESGRQSQTVESDFYNRPLKGQHPNPFWKRDKQ
ncbi:B-cell scaffold protein with ankyrin repeats-like [Mastacembelus armatus]|uniref:B-cell scaffold protein with ankyrin repeats-like n=1 Tax=Mastacembelus armatus TaxID=205130 RepID=UPI000E45985F|nr:B-cell scaffold protein with ankyrin repeats-like [Mastacembelus armatus]